MSRIWRRFVDAIRLPPPADDGPLVFPTAPPLPSLPTPQRYDPPPVPQRHAPQPADGLPNTFHALDRVDGVRPRLFDPALLHFRSAYRPGDPATANEETRMRWVSLRRRATDFVLRRIAESRFGDHLVLRGSRMLRAWCGDVAREPGDLDWVYNSPSQGRWSVEWEGRLIDRVCAGPFPEGVTFDRSAVATDDIWNYDRIPGRRLVFPWRVSGLPGGATQVDLVFGELLSERAQWEHVPAADGGCVTVRAATPAQSLAWKLLWLATDIHTQGKDLYDAVLLAERFPLSEAVLSATIPDARTRREAVGGPGGWAFHIDWDTFRTEYPWAAADGLESRLAAALAPLRAEVNGFDPPPPAPRPPACDPRWLTSAVVGLADGIAADRDSGRLPILADALDEAGCDDDEWLAHLRAGGPHTRGCAIVDRLRAATSSAQQSS